MRCADIWRCENALLLLLEIPVNVAAQPIPPRVREARLKGSPARLLVQRVGSRSVVRRCFATSPLRILTPRNHGHAAWAFTSTLGGGLVDDDRIRLHIEVEAGAAAVLSTQGETRVYRSPRGCQSELVARVEDDALLAVLPDPTVCFADARYSQRTEIALAPKGALVFADTLVAGRSARGERWAFRRYAAELTLRIGERVALAESVLLDPGHGPIGERFGPFEVLATLLIAGKRLQKHYAALRDELQLAPAPAHATLIESANSLGEDALLVRMASLSVEEAVRSIRRHLRFLPPLLGDDPWIRRN
jgi:urease accessory protein